MFKNRTVQKLAAALVLTVAATGTVVVAETPSYAVSQNPFTDVKEGNSHYNAIITLYNDGVVKGVTSTAYKPNEKALRGETALFLANALKLDTKNVTNPGFKDVPTTSKYYGAIAALHELGVINGYDDDTFRPNNQLTRSQFAKMITLGFELDLATSAKTKFADVNKLTDTNTKRYIQTLAEYEITSGTTPSTFSPNGKLTRAQLATFLYNSLEVAEGSFEVISVE